MAYVTESLPVTHKRFGRSALIGAIARRVASEQSLALRAAHKAALQRRNLTELRAMYVQPLDR